MEALQKVQCSHGGEEKFERHETVDGMKAVKTDKAPSPTGLQVESSWRSSLKFGMQKIIQRAGSIVD